ncbi:MAG: Rne/Rng family ribonuclease, partial [Nitrospinae bacterium]|nr:Rne/Rng family ribonuclease [Nitrospinota bacterium]
MAKKLTMMINADHPEECRAVILEDGKIEDYIVEHVSHEKIKGNIYLGVINRVEPSIEAAFVDFGGKKYGFLPFKDVLRESYIQTGERKAKTRIQDVLVRGQKMLVQVVKESRDAKGPSLTNSISIPGRFLVLTSSSQSSAVSRKIEDEAERKKLKALVADFKLPENRGLIIRTAGVGRTKTELQKDLQRLVHVWENLQKSLKDETQKPPFLIYQEADMVVRLVRDHFTNDTSEVLVDNVTSFTALKNFMKLIMPRMQNRIKLYQDTRPLFSKHNVEEQIESLYQRKVLLPSGGSIVFDSGEAMVCIDVNSGKTTGASQLEETALKTNLEAAEEIGRQLRLRDLGGLIVIDFIDMFHRKNQASVEKQLKKICKLDKARVNISRISKFGLMEMSRQRLAPPVREGAFVKCEACEGMGTVRSLNYTVLTVLRKIREHLATGRVKELKVEVSPQVTQYLLNNKAKFLLELQEKHQFKLEFTSQPGLAWTEYKYHVINKTAEEQAQQKAGVKDASEDTKGSEEGAEKTGRTSGGRDSRGRRGRSTQRKRYTRRPSSGRRDSSQRGRNQRPSRSDEASATGSPEASATGSPEAPA